MRQSIEERDYTEEITRWKELVSAVENDARDEEKAAIEILLGTPSPLSHSTASNTTSSLSTVIATTPTLTTAQKEAKRAVSALIIRSRKAFGFLYNALPVDLRTLVNEVPQGYAYGLWSFLEKKFRNTEHDIVK
jgi:pyruvate/oxaloacetate carboxyltransferase